jgi:hypothetical protein
MTNEPFSPEEQELIRRLREEARPQIDPAARDAIREHMIAEFRMVMAQPPAPAPRLLPRPAPMLAAAAALILVVVVIAQIARPPSPASETLTPPTQVAVVPSETPLPTHTPEPPTQTPQPATPTPTRTPIPPTAADTLMPTATPALPTPDAAVTPDASATMEMAIIVEGPISAIRDNVLTVYNLQVEIDPKHPILRLLEVGDPVRVEGMFSGGVVMADVVGNMDEITIVDGKPATVNLEGPVESISGSQIVVNGITAQLGPDAPGGLRVGDFVSVQGNFQNQNGVFVLVVVNVVIINDVTIIESNCWYHETGMGMGMGHWHCDGMGMGMGMGDAMGMGMGMGAR